MGWISWPTWVRTWVCNWTSSSRQWNIWKRTLWIKDTSLSGTLWFIHSLSPSFLSSSSAAIDSYTALENGGEGEGGEGEGGGKEGGEREGGGKEGGEREAGKLMALERILKCLENVSDQLMVFIITCVCVCVSRWHWWTKTTSHIWSSLMDLFSSQNCSSQYFSH